MRADQRFEVDADLVEVAEQLAHDGELGGYMVKAVVNRGESSQQVVIRTAHWFADGIHAHGVFIRCTVRRVDQAWEWRLFGSSVEVVGSRTGEAIFCSLLIMPARQQQFRS
jgi:hypothetical protein